MPGKGQAPKDPAQRRRRNADPTPQKSVSEDGELRGPDLPDTFEWHPQTHKWWDTWRRSAQAQTFLDTDWDFLLDTAVLHSRYWSGDATVAGELRLRAAKFGATPEDRARLRVQVTEPEKPKQESKSNSGHYSHLRVAK